MESIYHNGNIKSIILKLLSDRGSMYGYQIIKTIEELKPESLHISDGTIYPVLQELESDNIITSYHVDTKNRIRKYYTLNPSLTYIHTSKTHEIAVYLRSLWRIFDIKNVPI